MKAFIFISLSDACNAPLIIIKTFRETLYWFYHRALQTGVVVLLQGLFICALMQYIPTQYSKKQWLPFSLIMIAAKENWLDSLCYFIWLRNCYHRPVIYNYTVRKAGAILRCSPTTIAHHVAVLSSKGLCALTGADLRLKGVKQLGHEDTFLVPVGISHNKQEQRTLLRFTLTKRNLHAQIRKFTQKNNVLQLLTGNLKGYKEIKSAMRLAKKFPDHQQLESSMQSEFTMSNQKFGSLCNRSKSTGLKIQKALNNLGLIKSYSSTKLIQSKRMSKNQFYKLELGANHFLAGCGWLFKRLPNRIVLVGMEQLYSCDK